MLWRKMLRDILSNKGSYLACLVLVLIGLVVFTAFSILSDNLRLSKEGFYTGQNFADGFVELTSMPQRHVERLSRIDGIKHLSGRLVREVRLYAPQRQESVYLRLVTLDLTDPQRVNDALLLDGTELTGGALNAWIDNKFFEANGLELGQDLQVIAGGRLHELTLTGVGMSPEFTYPLRDLKELYPNPEQFGIAFVPLEDMATLFPDTRDRVNDLVFTLEAGADFDRVKELLEPELDQYGLRLIYSREDQISHVMLAEEINGINSMSKALPLLFLSIAGIILYIMLKRLVEQQRGQIGLLKAFGYTNREVVVHYLSYALVLGSIGGLIGGSLGILMATPLTKMLLMFFNVPAVFAGFSLYHLVMGLLLSVSIFLFAGYHGCKDALKLEPAEAMRPPAPPFSGKSFLERFGFFWGMLTIQGMMAVRNLSRNPGRSIFLFLGIMISCAVIAMTWSMNDMVDKLVFYQFEEVETYDAKMTLSLPADRKTVVRELEKLPEVTRVEPLLEVPVALSHKWLEENVLLLGIAAESTFYNILDKRSNRIAPAKDGLILSERLAQKLDVQQGDLLDFGSPLFRLAKDQQVEVVEIIPQYLGMNAYMELSALEGMLRQGKLATSLLIGVGGNTDETVGQSISTLRDRYRESDFVAGVDGREERFRQTRELMETFGSAIYLYVFIGVITGFSIIYSSSFIILSERSRELASMMVLGMTPREVFSVITFEQWFISLFAILAGIPLAQMMQWGMAMEMSTDMYTIPGELSMQSLYVAPLIAGLSIWLAQRFVLSKIEKLSLIDVLKTRE